MNFNRKKSKIITFILSFIPGMGHMYLGLVTKGVTLMSLIFSLIFVVILVTDSSSMYWLAGYLIPTLSVLFVSYSVFDSLATADRINSGEPVNDEGIKELRLLKEMIRRRKYFCGWILLVLACIGILNIFSSAVGQFIYRFFGINFSLSGFAITLILIALGLWFIKEGRLDV